MIAGLLGRRPHDPGAVARCVQARDVLNLSTLPSRPAARDWGMVAGVDVPYQMWLNDQLSNCVIASMLGQMTTWAAQTGTPFLATDADALAGYEKFGGYVPGDPSTDNGVVMLDVAQRLRSGDSARGAVAQGVRRRKSKRRRPGRRDNRALRGPLDGLGAADRVAGS